MDDVEDFSQFNDTNFEDFSQFEDIENIRDPDKVITERLLPYNNTNNEQFELEQILEISKKEYEEKQLIIIQEKIEKMELLSLQRKQKFEKIKEKCLKLISFDINNTEMYNTILSIIKKYENSNITMYSLKQSEYNKIMTFMKTLRLSKEEFNQFDDLLNIVQ